MFADDTKMLKGIFGKDDEIILQHDLNRIHNWSQDSLMQCHPARQNISYENNYKEKGVATTRISYER